MEYNLEVGEHGPIVIYEEGEVTAPDLVAFDIEFQFYSCKRDE